ncbi:Translation initiation factor IF-3 [bacterium HR07]|uniref:Translation initiation factor IF-3 n=2 Tax=Candidatus Bipolaricaulota TaxID=67810 RepID=H5SF52_9BACT|nr:translation initiation factor IF-3 [uncultured Acetothermia bacterium]BAL59867.1 translation initiation factor IF-3 [Candidatus Acetothermum autotrophicum]GBC76299.1 Translation initiation factor IF-3 [bacterium HR07]
MPLAEAIQEARKRNLDLVEVAPQATPVVCKFVDFGKYRYRQEKREKKRPRGGKLKEIRMTTQIEKHDFETKLRHIRKFLTDEDKVRVTVIFRGREIVHINRGRELLERIAKETADIGRVEQYPKERGRSLQMLLVPGKGAPAAPTKAASEQAVSEPMTHTPGGYEDAQEEDAQGDREAL